MPRPLWLVFIGLGVAVACAGMAAVGTVLTAQQQARSAWSGDLIDQVVLTAFDLDQVTFDLITGADAEAEDRWNHRIHRLNRSLERLRKDLNDAALEHRLRWMEADLRRADRLFGKLAGVPGGDFASERRQLIGGQLQVHTRLAVTQAEAMQRRLSQLRLDDVRRGTWFFGVVSAVLAAVLTTTVVLVLRYERRLAFETRALERSNADLERFAFVCSHDLREPLRMVSSYLELLAARATGLDQPCADFLARARQGTERMQTLVRRLLALSRLGTRQAIAFSPVALGPLLSEALGELAPRLRKAGAVVQTGSLPTVRGDATLLRQVMVNLVTNALVHAGQRPPTIVITAEPGDGERTVLIRVEDDGPGVPEDQRERVFTPFVRLHAHRGSDGIGLGLAICRRIIELHQGRIWIEASIEGGASVRMQLMMA